MSSQVAVRLAVFLAIVGVSLGRGGVALAQTTASCTDAAMHGQSDRDAHRLLAARDEFGACAAAACPTVVQRDCAAWLADVEARLPTVVPALTDDAGADLAGVTVRVDGRLLEGSTDGQSIALDPGPHKFDFETRDRAGTMEIVLREGEKDRRLAMVLPLTRPPAPAPAPAPPPAVPTVATPPSAPGSTQAGAAPSPAPPAGHRAWRTTGYVLAGLGAIGLGVGAAFGVLAIEDKSAADCSASGVCSNASALYRLRTESAVSTTGLVTGAILGAGGVGLLLFVPSGPATSGVRLASAASPGAAWLVLSGQFE